MWQIYFYTILSVVIVSLISLIGILSLFLSKKGLKSITLFFVSFSAGTLLGDAFIHLLPEAIDELGTGLTVWIWLLFGILIFFVLEKIIFWRHCHVQTSESHPHPLGMMNLIGDCLHNFIDGIIIAGSFLIDVRLGIATTIAVIAHEIPQEIGDFGVLIHAGYSRLKAITLNFITALTALAGAIITLIVGAQFENLIFYILPMSAGGFIYIATADLIPELKKDTAAHKSVIQLLFIIIGIGLMILLKSLD